MKKHFGRPLPPKRLRERVGSLPYGINQEEAYLELGSVVKEAIIKILPEDWEWEGKSVLDFGCGAARTLRHFLSESENGDFWGSDIDEPSIVWCNKHLSPPLSFSLNQNGELPPLNFPNEKFDLIYAMSVFSHLDDHWAAWLIELNRILAPGGRMIISFMGEGMSHVVAEKSWHENDVGMTVYAPGNPWNSGGPMVLLSPWWIKEHWGRLFEIEKIEGKGFAEGSPIRGVHDHGFVVLRKSNRNCTISELEEPHPDELVTIYKEMLRLRADAGRGYGGGGSKAHLWSSSI